MIWENCGMERKRNGAILTFFFFPPVVDRTAVGGAFRLAFFRNTAFQCEKRAFFLALKNLTAHLTAESDINGA
jgi:hypothetical protein